MRDYKPTRDQLTRWGEPKYGEGLKKLKAVRAGSFEGGILPVYRKRAGRLLRHHESLSRNQVERLQRWIANGTCRDTEDALNTLRRRKESR